MGTNYYWTANPCPTCGNGERLHIGKSSSGWCFGLHVIPENRIRTLADWMERWQVGEIRNEYGDHVSPEDMLLVITARSFKQVNDPVPEFLRQNHAKLGPNGLLCRDYPGTTHGDGTYDLVEGEFS